MGVARVLLAAGVAAAVATCVGATNSPEFRSMELPPVLPAVTFEVHTQSGPASCRGGEWSPRLYVRAPGRKSQPYYPKTGEVTIMGAGPGVYRFTYYTPQPG